MKKLLKLSAINLTGQLYKLGVKVANDGVVTKAGKMQIEMNKQKKAEQLETKFKRETALKTEAEDLFKKFVTAGWPATLPAKDSKVILKLVLYCLAPEEKF